MCNLLIFRKTGGANLCIEVAKLCISGDVKLCIDGVQICVWEDAELYIGDAGLCNEAVDLCIWGCKPVYGQGAELCIGVVNLCIDSDVQKYTPSCKKKQNLLYFRYFYKDYQGDYAQGFFAHFSPLSCIFL